MDSPRQGLLWLDFTDETAPADPGISAGDEAQGWLLRSKNNEDDGNPEGVSELLYM